MAETYYEENEETGDKICLNCGRKYEWHFESGQCYAPDALKQEGA